MKPFYIHEGNRIYTDLRNQTAPSGRDFRLVGITKVTTKPIKWINKSEKWHWILEYRYTDKSNLQEGFDIEIDYNDEKISFVKKCCNSK
jgi:hypothetical protein